MHGWHDPVCGPIHRALDEDSCAGHAFSPDQTGRGGRPGWSVWQRPPMPNPDNGIPRCRHWSARGRLDPLAVANKAVAGHRPGHPDHAGRQAVPQINLGGPKRRAPSAATTGASRDSAANACQAVEYVIRRAGPQMGPSFVGCGGSLQGPKGVDRGPTLGF